jgi:hypothetical protein
MSWNLVIGGFPTFHGARTIRQGHRGSGDVDISQNSFIALLGCSCDADTAANVRVGHLCPSRYPTVATFLGRTQKTDWLELIRASPHGYENDERGW